jgi:hypothetical protein
MTRKDADTVNSGGQEGKRDSPGRISPMPWAAIPSGASIARTESMPPERRPRRPRPGLVPKGRPVGACPLNGSLDMAVVAAPLITVPRGHPGLRHHHEGDHHEIFGDGIMSASTSPRTSRSRRTPKGDRWSSPTRQVSCPTRSGSAAVRAPAPLSRPLPPQGAPMSKKRAPPGSVNTLERSFDRLLPAPRPAPRPESPPPAGRRIGRTGGEPVFRQRLRRDEMTRRRSSAPWAPAPRPPPGLDSPWARPRPGNEKPVP